MRLPSPSRRTMIGVIALLAAAAFGIVLIVSSPPSPSSPTGEGPVAEDDTVALPADDAPVVAHVLSNDHDPEGDLDPTSLIIRSEPGAGTASAGLDGSITYSPGGEFLDQDVLEYEVCDSGQRCDVAAVDITSRLVEPTDSTIRFAVFGDYGDNSNGAAAVASLVARLDPDFIVTTGDNSYDVPDYDLNVGQHYSSFIGGYQGSYGSGSTVNRFFPSLGDHEYSDGGIDPYLDFFDLPGGGVETSGTSGNERYYDFVVGPVHGFILNVQPEEPDGTTPGSPQGRWLQERLAESVSPWRVVVSPVPPFSSGDNHGSDPRVQWPYDQWGADAVFSGDDHVYERIVLDDLPYFVSGLGGRSLYGFDRPVDGSAFRYAEDFGVLMVEACDTRLGFEFHSISDGIVDRHELGAESCP